MHILKTITTISLALLLSISTANATSEDSTDVRESILNSLSRNHQEYLGYQSSTVEMYRNYNNNRFAINSPELHFFGGDDFSHDLIINGLSFRNPLTGRSNISLATPFFENINSYLGAIPIQYSNANSAVTVLTSPALSNNLQGYVETSSDNFVGNKFDQNYYRGTFSGSLSKNNKLKFWTAFERKWLGDRLPSSLTSDVLDGSPDILPNNQLSGWTYHGKLQYELSAKSLFTITADATTDEWQEYRHYFNNPDEPNQIAHTPRNKDDNFGINALIEHKLSKNTDINISYGYFKSEHIDGDGVLLDDLEAYSRNFYNPQFDNYGLFREGAYAGINGSYVESYYDGFQRHISTYKQFRGEVNHTYNEIHQIKIGLLYKKYNLRYFNHSFATLENGSLIPVALYLNRYGFDANGNESDDETYQNDAKEPKETSLYFNDIISLEDVTLNFGFRFDRYDYDALRLKNPLSPFDPDTLDAADQTIDETDLVKADVQTSFNPHIGLDFKIDDNTKLYFSFNQNYQILPYRNMYQGWDYFDVRLGSGLPATFANSAIEPQKSNTINLGVSSKISDRMSLDAKLTNVEYENKLVPIVPEAVFPYSYTTYKNIGSSSYIGLNLILQYDNSKNFTGFVDITKSKAEGNDVLYSRNILWNNGSGSAEDNPLDYDRTYKIVAGASYQTNFGLKINIIAKQESGYPYTPMQPFDAVTFRSVDENPTGFINSDRSEATRVVDLKLEKEFKFLNKFITAFILVKNLLDKENITGVYPGTGSPTNTAFLNTPAGIENIETNRAEYEGLYNLAKNNPMNFNPPRQIFFGLKTSF